MKYKVTILFLLWMIPVCRVFAQPYGSDLGRFEVDQIKGCAPLTVNVTIRPPFICNGANPCDMDFESNNQFQALTFTHTYSQPGTYVLRILFQTSGFDQVTVTVLPNTQPEFEVYSCGGNSAQIKVTDTNYNQYVINYNDGSPDVVVPSGNLAKDNHTFASSGNKTITVRGRNLGADDNCNPTNKSVDALVTLPAPVITQLQVLDNASIGLDFDNQPNILYKLEIATNSTTFQQLQNVYNSATATINNLRTDDNFYCFRLGAFDPCNNTTVYSNTICSSNFDVAAQNNQNHLAWTTVSSGINSYSITKSTSGPLAAAPPATTVDDTNVICGTDYCYRLTALYANGSQSISLEKCATAFSTTIPTVVEDITASVAGDNTLALQWTQDPAFTAASYNVLKSGSLIGTATTTTFTDTDYAPDAGSCYSLSYTDACGNKSPTSIQACPINLTATLQADNSINLSWTPYSGWKNGVDHYLVEKFDTDGQLLSSSNTGTATVLLDNVEDLTVQVYVYRITAVPVDAAVAPAASNMITITKEPNLFYPSAFTPNVDGLNDTFKVFGQYTAEVEFKIFNRWGELLFITTDLNLGWDGTYKGNLMPEGTYVFRAKLTDLAGRISDRSGTIVLLRKR